MHFTLTEHDETTGEISVTRLLPVGSGIVVGGRRGEIIGHVVRPITSQVLYAVELHREDGSYLENRNGYNADAFPAWYVSTVLVDASAVDAITSVPSNGHHDL